MFFLDSEDIGMGDMLPPLKNVLFALSGWGGNKKFKWGEIPSQFHPKLYPFCKLASNFD